MKIFVTLFACAFIFSCKTTGSLSLTELEQHAVAAPVEDSVLHALQQQYDVVIGAATENYAWIRNVTYTLLCKKDNSWTGYSYYKNNMPPGDKKNYIAFTLTPAAVNNNSCDSLLASMLQHKVWDIKGDSENGFCSGDKQCNITDAATKRLWVITQTKFIAPSYYAPEFFEECCPGNEQRKQFLDITARIQGMVPVTGIQQ